LLSYFLKRLAYGLAVLVGVVVLVFVLFQGFGDPARLVMGQRADAVTRENIRRDLHLDQPRWKQFVLYLNDISPIAVHTRTEIADKQLRGFFIGGETVLALKLPYLRRSYQSRRDVGTVIMETLPGTLLLAVAAMLLATVAGIGLGVLAALYKNT